MVENSSNYVLKCSKCGNAFFTTEEKKKYQERGYQLPRLCGKCR